MLKTLILSVLVSGIGFANVCTPLNAPANGPFPAIPSSGVDGISWSIARVSWTSDATASIPATQQRIIYATAAEWASNANVYPHTTAMASQTVTVSTTIQNGIVSNLLPNTLYHVKGQSYQGGAWCTAADQTFTTLPKPPGLIKPTLPQSVNTSRPAMTGTHWVYGTAAVSGYTNCPSQTAGTTYAIVTANLQHCLDAMVTTNGDDLGLPPQALGGPSIYPISQANFHNSENAISLTASGSMFTSAGATPANGHRLSWAGKQRIAAFQVQSIRGNALLRGQCFRLHVTLSATSGGTPITLTSAGAYGFLYLPWPITQPTSVIHSTAAPDQLPPVGVRLGPDALAQYYPYMPNLQAVDPLHGATSVSYLQLGPLTENITFENIRFSVDPTVATSTNPTDPVAFKSPIVVGTGNLATTGITWDQCAFDPGPAPTRVQAIALEGSNNSIVNSYVYLDFWQPHYQQTVKTYPSFTSNVGTFPAFTWSYVGSAGTKVQCINAGGTVSLTGGTVTGAIYASVSSSCAVNIRATTGLTVSSTIPGSVITYSASPAFPTYTYTSPLGGTITTNAEFNWWNVVIITGTIANQTITFGYPGNSAQALEGAIGTTMDGYGPFKFDNNYIVGSAIGGIFYGAGANTIHHTMRLDKPLYGSDNYWKPDSNS